MDNTPLLSLGEEDTPQTDTLLSISAENKAVLPETVIKERSEKANFGLKSSSPGLESLRASIGRGDENYAREQAATAVDLKNRQIRLGIIEKIASESPNGQISPETMDFVKGLSQEQLENPQTIFESEYSKEFFNKLALNKKQDDALFNKQLVNNPDDTLDTMDIGTSILTRQEITRTKLQDLNSRWEETGFWGKAGEIAETVIPFKSWSNISNEVPGFRGDGFDLPGSNLKQQVQYLWSLPPREFEAKLTETLNGIAASNLLDAQTFAQAVMSFGTSDHVLQNTFGIFDLFDAGTLAVAGGKIARSIFKGSASRSAEQQVRQATIDALKASEKVPTRAENVAEVVGDVEKATTIKAIQNVTAEATDAAVLTGPDRFRGILNMVPSISKPTQVLDDLGHLTREAGSRLSTKLETSAARLTDALMEPVQALRLTPEALAKAVDNAKYELREEFSHVNDSVLDVLQNPTDMLTNTTSVSIRLGDPKALPFDSLERAEVWANDLYELTPGSWRIKQEGTNFYIDIPKAIDETKDSVRALQINTENTTPSFNNIATMFLGWLRSPAETASKMSKANRQITALAQEHSLKYAKEVAKALGEVPKNLREDFETILRVNRDWVDPATSERGMFHRTVGELESSYLSNLGRMPTEQEVSAYFSYVQLSDYDWIVRNTIMLRDKERQGLKRFAFEYRGEFEDGNPFFTKTQPFEGKEVSKVPWNTDHLSVLLYDPATQATQVITRNAGGETRAMVDQMIREGAYKVVQIADPVGRPLKEVTGSNEPIQYVITKSFDKTELATKQVGYQPGGHVQYAHDFWVKQPKLYRAEGGWFYEGDMTAFNFSSQAQANKFSQRMEQARQLLKAGDDTALERYLEKNLPYSKSSFKELFSEEGFFNPGQPFFTTQGGQKWTDSNQLGKGVKDLTEGNYNLNSEIDRTFTGHRDQNGFTIREAGTDVNPVFKLQQAELIDPLSTLARGIGQVTRSRYFGDMKTHAAESFIQEFQHALDVPLDQLRQMPMYYLLHPKWNEKADKVLLERAKYTQRNALNFIGQQTPFSQKMEWVKNKIVDSVYKVAGDTKADTLSNSAMMQSRDPLSFFRATAFHMKLGLFNPAQWFVQAQGLTHMMAISPRQAPAAMSGYTIMRRLMMNDAPEIVDGAAKMASKLGWKKDQFVESWEAMKRTGWFNVGREQAMLDDMSDPKLFSGTMGNWLDKATLFFKEGERMVRMAGWNAAYLEFRKANPTVKLTDREIGQILVRADTLTGNMTRASKAAYEQGILSIPTQFSSYQLRLLDQFTGKQLSRGEKQRAFLAYSAMYGVPVGVGATTAYPFYEDFKQYALENGMSVNDKFLNLFIEGGLSTIISGITGEDYNVAQRYGPGGLSLIRDLASGDKHIAEILVGPSGQVVSDIIKSTHPVLQGIAGVFEEGGSYEPLVADLIEASRTISSVNNLLRMGMALNTGKYITKNDIYLSDMSTMDAIFTGITGLSPREVSDAFLMSRSLKETKELQKEAEKQFQKYYRRGLNEGANGNNNAMEAYFKRARAYLVLGDIQPNEYADVLSRAMSNQGSVVERMSQRWFRDAPASQVQKRFNQTIQNTEEMQKRK